MVLNAMRMRRYLAGFKVGVAQAQIEGLRKQQARIQYYERLKVRTLRAFALYSVASKRDRELKKSLKYFRSHSLASRTLSGLKENVNAKKKKVKDQIVAKRHYTHYQSIILSKSFFVLLEHGRQRRNKSVANEHFRHWQLFQHFKLLKFYTLLQRCQRNQIKQVACLQYQSLKVKAFRALQEATEETRARLDLLRMWSGRLKMRRVLRALRANSKQNLIRYPPTNGNFLRFSELWLRSSFSDLMHTVWEEFPK